MELAADRGEAVRAMPSRAARRLAVFVRVIFMATAMTGGYGADIITAVKLMGRAYDGPGLWRGYLTVGRASPAPTMQREGPAASEGFPAAQFHESETLSHSLAVPKSERTFT